MPNNSMPSKKEIRWLTSGLIAGATVGLVIGVAVSGIQSSKTENSYDQSRLSAQSLGWSSLNDVYDASKAFSLSYNKALYGDILAALSNRYSLALKEMPISSSSSTKSIQSRKLVLPDKILASSATKSETSRSNSGYLDGTGPVDINNATLQQIDDVPRMSTDTAKLIRDFIKTKGPIKSFNELDQIKNVGPKTIEKLRSLFHIGK
jgi:competence protein ComEA